MSLDLFCFLNCNLTNKKILFLPNSLCDRWFRRRGLDNLMKQQYRPDAPTTVKNDHWVCYARRMFEDVNLPGAEGWTPGGSVPVVDPPDWQPPFHG